MHLKKWRRKKFWWFLKFFFEIDFITFNNSFYSFNISWYTRMIQSSKFQLVFSSFLLSNKITKITKKKQKNTHSRKRKTNNFFGFEEGSIKDFRKLFWSERFWVRWRSNWNNTFCGVAWSSSAPSASDLLSMSGEIRSNIRNSGRVRPFDCLDVGDFLFSKIPLF